MLLKNSIETIVREEQEQALPESATADGSRFF
jgi:hypothetical protein